MGGTYKTIGACFLAFTTAPAFLVWDLVLDFFAAGTWGYRCYTRVSAANMVGAHTSASELFKQRCREADHVRK